MHITADWGEWLGGSNAEAQFRRSLTDDLRGVAASLVEQLVYEGALIVGRDELLMNLRNTTVHSVSAYNNNGTCLYHIW